MNLLQIPIIVRNEEKFENSDDPVADRGAISPGRVSCRSQRQRPPFQRIHPRQGSGWEFRHQVGDTFDAGDQMIKLTIYYYRPSSSLTQAISAY